MTWLTGGESLVVAGSVAVAVRGLVEIVLVLLVPRSERVRAIRALRGRRDGRQRYGRDDVNDRG